MLKKKLDGFVIILYKDLCSQLACRNSGAPNAFDFHRTRVEGDAG